MKKWLLLLFLATMPLSASDNSVKPYSDIASLEGGMQTIVDGKVSMISREPVFIETDMIIPAINPIQIHRSYQRPSQKWEKKDPFWSINYFRCGKYSEDPYSYKQHFYCTDENGTLLQCSTDNKKYGKWVSLTNSYYYGETNIARGAISGKSNLKNYRVNFNHDSNGMQVKAAGGCIKRFIKRTKGGQIGWPYEGETHALVDIHYPNGFATHISFLSETELNLTTHGANGQQMCRLLFAGLANDLFKKSDSPFYFLYAEDGRHVRYDFDRKSFKTGWYGLLKKVSGPTIPTVEYTYDASKEDDIEHLVRRTDSEGGYCEFDYYRRDKKYSTEGIHWDKENWTSLNIDTKKDFWYNHGVKSIKAPSGPKDAPVETHRFVYPRETRSEVYDYFNHLTTYHCDDRYRPTKIVYYELPKSTKKVDLIDENYWGEPDQAEETFLQTRVLSDGKNPLQYRGKNYLYDKYGNPEMEITFGNLTGKGGVKPKMGKYGEIDLSQVEHHTKISTFDELHNLKSELYPNGLFIRYEYDPGTDRLRSKTIEDLSTTTYRYNDAGALIEEVETDGICYKRIRRHTPRMSAPCFGLPEATEEFYVDSNGNEVLLTRQQFEYHRNGQLKKRSTFDVVETWDDLDAFDHCTTEVTKTGETIRRRYDSLGNILEEVGPHPDFKKTFIYDKMHRLRYKTESFQGKTKTYAYDYDEMSRPLSYTNPYFQTTTYVTDRYGRVLETHHPDGSIEQSVYDGFNNEVLKIDRMGYITNTSYTSHDKPYYILYPDGSTERSTYDLAGNPVEFVSKSGQVTTYYYDKFSRLCKKVAEGEETTIYEGKLIASVTDAEKNVRTFTYDGAGRKTSETFGRHTTRFEYDSFGRLYKTLYPEGSRVEIFDGADRVTESWLEDPDGTKHNLKSLKYDPFGNVSLEVEGDRVTTYDYDAWGRLRSKTDPKGYTTTWIYEESTFLVRREIDGETGYQTVETYNVMGLVEKLEKLDFLGNVLQTVEYLYDLGGNKTDEIHGNKKIHWEYDAMGRVKREVEAYESDLSRTTSIHYNSRGEKEWEQKPDGNKIAYTYYLNGLVKEVQARDCHYLYTYDALNRMEKVEDRMHGLHVTRSYYPSGSIKQERFNDFEFTYVYDSLDRPTLITLPDKTTIGYTYNITTMTRVDRPSYSHHYTHFDPYGNVTEERLLDGSLRTRRYDILGQLESTTHPQFSLENLRYNRWGSLKERTIDGRLETYDYDGLHQLTLENGTSYSYDALHNRTQKDGETYDVNLLDQVLSSSTETFAYDLNGNLKERITNGQKTLYSYDGLDRLIKVETGIAVTEYRYDGLNRRLIKLGREKEEYWYLDNNEVGSVVNKTLRSLRVLGLGRGAEIGASIALELSGKLYIPHHDQAGNLVAIHNETLKEVYRYTAFGEHLPEGLSPWRFASKRLDPETGYLYFGRRYYDPRLGKFITKDPSGFTDGANLYAYVHNRPLTHFDLYGLWDFLEGLHQVFGTAGGALIALGNWVMPQNHLARYNVDYSQNTPYFIPYGEGTNSNYRITGCGGIDCGPNDSWGFVPQLSLMFSGMEVNFIHNGSFGIFNDVQRYLHEAYRNCYSDVSMLLTQDWEMYLGANPNSFIYHYCHSEGVAATKQSLELLPAELRKRVVICAVAPGCYIPRDLCDNVTYFVSRHDLVHRLDLVGYHQNKDRIVTLDPHPSSSWLDHNSSSKTFTPYYTQHFLDFQKEFL